MSPQNVVETTACTPLGLVLFDRLDVWVLFAGRPIFAIAIIIIVIVVVVVFPRPLAASIPLPFAARGHTGAHVGCAAPVRAAVRDRGSGGELVLVVAGGGGGGWCRGGG